MAALASSTALVFLFIAITASWAAFASESSDISVCRIAIMSCISVSIPIEFSVLLSWSAPAAPFSVTC